MEAMMRDPSMQKLIYPYLPEGMRNPQTFEWMLKNPATRSQLEGLLKQNGGFPGMAAGGPMADAMKNFDMNAPEVKQQFEAMGMKPEEVVSKIMASPDMTAAFQNPRIQAAIMDCSANPMNIAKYQDDAEIMGARCSSHTFLFCSPPIVLTDVATRRRVHQNQRAVPDRSVDASAAGLWPLNRGE